MKPLAGVAVKSFLCNTLRKRTLDIGMMVASYVADIPESEDWLRVKKASRAAVYSHMCEARREEMYSYLVAPRKCCSKTKAMLNETSRQNSARVQVTQQVDKMSMFPVVQFLVSILFTEIGCRVDVYLFCFLYRANALFIVGSKLLT